MNEAPNLNLEPGLSGLTDQPGIDGADEIGLAAEMEPTVPGLQEVKVETYPAAGRQRRLSAQLFIGHTVEQIWQVLTDYDHLADFIPNLAKSQRIPHPTGSIRLEQVGAQRLLRFNFCARVVLDMEEFYPKRIAFSMVEGDFNEFSGYWQLTPTLPPTSAAGTTVEYGIAIVPKRFMPISIIERRLRHDLAVNLLAVRQRVEQLFPSL